MLWVILGSFLIGLLTLLLGSVAGFYFLGLATLLLAVGLKKIPADPPTIALITVLGRRISRIKKEGYRLFLPPLYDFIPIEVKKENLDLKPENVRTPDLAELEVPISITYTPGPNFINFINVGKKGGVENIITDMLMERVRQWCISPDQPPRTFEEALMAREEGIEMLIRTLTGDEITKDIPDEEIRAIRAGNGLREIPQLGITLNRLNIKDIRLKPGSALEKAAEQKVKEEREREAEKVELDHIKERMKELVTDPDLEFTPQDARDIVQMERNKNVKREIRDFRGFDIKGAAEAIAGAVAQIATASKKDGKNDERDDAKKNGGDKK